jgi:hypothetical protein
VNGAGERRRERNAGDLTPMSRLRSVSTNFDFRRRADSEGCAVVLFKGERTGIRFLVPRQSFDL